MKLGLAGERGVGLRVEEEDAAAARKDRFGEWICRGRGGGWRRERGAVGLPLMKD